MEKYFENYLEELSILKNSERTITAHRHHTGLFLKYLDKKGILKLTDVDLNCLREYLGFISSGKYSLHTIDLKIRCIRKFFLYLERKNVLLINPALNLEAPKIKDKYCVKVLTQEEMKRLLEAPDMKNILDLRDKALMELLYSTGIRLNECLNLKVLDVDIKEETLRINNGKGGKDRVLPLGKTACKHLENYLTNFRERYRNREKALFISAYGKMIRPDTIATFLNKHAKKAGIEKRVTVHTIRRSFATHLLDNDANPVYIQRLLGHSRPDTLNFYLKINGREVKKTHELSHPREKDKIPAIKKVTKFYKRGF